MKKIRIGTLSRRVIISVLSVVLISFMFLTGVLTYWSYEQMDREYNQVMQAYISNVNLSFSRYMEDVSALLEKYYTSFDGIIVRNSKTYELTEHAKLQNEVREQMEPFYHSFFILNKEGKVIFDTRKGVSFPMDLEESMEEMAKGQGVGTLPVVWTAQNLYPDQPDIHMLTIYLQDAPAGDARYSGSVVINVDICFLSRHLFKDSDRKSFETYIINQNGDVVAHSDESALGQNMSGQPHIQEILKNRSGSERIKIDGKWVNLEFQKTDYKDYYVVTQSLYSGGFLEAVRIMPVSLLILDFIVSVVLIYFLTNRLFRPFNDVTAHMRDAFEQEYDIKKIYDDVQFLEEYHQLTRNHVHKLHAQNEKNLIVKSLLQDTWNQEMQRFLIDRNMIIKDKQYCVVILQIRAAVAKAEENIDSCIKRRAFVEDVIGTHMECGIKCTCLELGLRKLMLILSARNTSIDRDFVLQKLESIKHEVLDNQKVEVQYAVSDMEILEKISCDTLYKQAKKRLEEQNEEVCQGNKSKKNRIEAHTNQEMLERVVDYLYNNYQDPDINVSNLAEQFHINNAYLGKLFQEFAGQSILSYLLDIRMKKAKDLLMTCPEMSVSQVASAVGFGSNAYFTTSFRKYYGVSPSKIWDFNVEGISENKKHLREV